MKNLFLLLFINFLLFGQLNAQNKSAVPPSGEANFLTFIRDNFKLTPEGEAAHLNGELVIEFHVTEAGKVDSFHIVNDLGYDSALQLIKTVKKAGDWDPLLVEGVATSSWVRFPLDLAYFNSLVDAKPTNGYEAFMKNFNEYFMIPEAAANANAYGDYIIRFDVGVDGKLSAIKLVDDPGFGILERAKYALLRSGLWSPAKKEGQNLVSTVEVPFTIELKRARRF